MEISIRYEGKWLTVCVPGAKRSGIALWVLALKYSVEFPSRHPERGTATGRDAFKPH